MDGVPTTWRAPTATTEKKKNDIAHCSHEAHLPVEEQTICGS